MFGGVLAMHAAISAAAAAMLAAEPPDCDPFPALADGLIEGEVETVGVTMGVPAEVVFVLEVVVAPVVDSPVASVVTA